MEPDTVTAVTPDTLAVIREQAQRRAAEAREASARIQAIRAEGRSDRGLVTAVVDGSALLVDVEYSAGASSTPAMLGSMLKQAHDRAVEEWHRQVGLITEDTLGDQPQLRETIQATATAGLVAHTGGDPGDDDGASGAARHPGAR